MDLYWVLNSLSNSLNPDMYKAFNSSTGGDGGHQGKDSYLDWI